MEPRTIGRMPTPSADDPADDLHRIARCTDRAALAIADHLDATATSATDAGSDAAALDVIFASIRVRPQGPSTALEDLTLAATALLAGVDIDPSHLLVLHPAGDIELGLEHLLHVLRP